MKTPSSNTTINIGHKPKRRCKGMSMEHWETWIDGQLRQVKRLDVSLDLALDSQVGEARVGVSSTWCQKAEVPNTHALSICGEVEWVLVVDSDEVFAPIFLNCAQGADKGIAALQLLTLRVICEWVKVLLDNEGQLARELLGLPLIEGSSHHQDELADPWVCFSVLHNFLTYGTCSSDNRHTQLFSFLISCSLNHF